MAYYKGYSIKQVSPIGVARYQIFSVTGALMTTKVFFSELTARKFIDEVVCGQEK